MKKAQCIILKRNNGAVQHGPSAQVLVPVFGRKSMRLVPLAVPHFMIDPEQGSPKRGLTKLRQLTERELAARAYQRRIGKEVSQVPARYQTVLVAYGRPGRGRSRFLPGTSGKVI